MSVFMVFFDFLGFEIKKLIILGGMGRGMGLWD
jgi:hypothetical protein